MSVSLIMTLQCSVLWSNLGSWNVCVCAQLTHTNNPNTTADQVHPLMARADTTGAGRPQEVLWPCLHVRAVWFYKGEPTKYQAGGFNVVTDWCVYVYSVLQLIITILFIGYLAKALMYIQVHIY